MKGFHNHETLLTKLLDIALVCGLLARAIINSMELDVANNSSVV